MMVGCLARLRLWLLLLLLLLLQLLLELLGFPSLNALAVLAIVVVIQIVVIGGRRLLQLQLLVVVLDEASLACVARYAEHP